MLHGKIVQELIQVTKTGHSSVWIMMAMKLMILSAKTLKFHQSTWSQDTTMRISLVQVVIHVMYQAPCRHAAHLIEKSIAKDMLF